MCASSLGVSGFMWASGARVQFIARKFNLSRFRVHAILNQPQD